MRKLRSKSGVAVCVAAVAAAMAAPSSATAATPQAAGAAKTPPSKTAAESPEALQDTFDQQLKLDAALNAIVAAAGKDPSGAGYAGDSVDIGAYSVSLNWHGALPPTVAAELKRVRRDGIAVNLHEANFTWQELKNDAERIASQAHTAEGFPISSAAPSNDGNSVTVKVDPGIKRGVRAFAPGMQKKLAATLSTNGIPAIVIPGAGQVLTENARAYDTSPFSGGALANIFAGTTYLGGCTTGIGVIDDAPVGNHRYIYTARHCGSGMWKTGRGLNIGPTNRLDTGRDVMLVATNSRNAIYDGPFYDSNEGPGQVLKTRAITRAGVNHRGDVVCDDGSYSGTICGLQITEVGVTIVAVDDKGNQFTFHDQVNYQEVNRDAGPGNGDSGSGLFVPTGPDTGEARGTASTGQDGTAVVPCLGIPSSKYRQCAWAGSFGDIGTGFKSLKVHIG